MTATPNEPQHKQNSTGEYIPATTTIQYDELLAPCPNESSKWPPTGLRHTKQPEQPSHGGNIHFTTTGLNHHQSMAAIFSDHFLIYETPAKQKLEKIYWKTTPPPHHHLRPLDPDHHATRPTHPRPMRHPCRWAYRQSQGTAGWRRNTSPSYDEEGGNPSKSEEERVRDKI
ncbi:hypothetical protein RHMOL_Rhmol09G0006300 [Rhododendron molle]|uniref:Uncharacterized protein n=1 Tax=Rhododendron molle TaxID=49168 RepID=A0ACC0M8L7_RHOML|nr:hypothetical protein RHMOL_Rhmol09G0006300 [Rhododendron molle]